MLADLREALADEVGAARVSAAELSELASRLPGVASVLLDLSRRNQALAGRLAEAAELRGGGGPDLPRSPHEEIREFFYRRQNYLHEADVAAEELAAQIGVRPGEVVTALAARLTGRHGIRLATAADRQSQARGRVGQPPSGAARQRRKQQGHFRRRGHGPAAPLRPGRAGAVPSSRLRPGQPAFRMATQLALLEYGREISNSPRRTTTRGPRPGRWRGSGSPTTSRAR
ncbi:DNA-binding protein OS=Streptomyces microflavus OX=1919 GN=Smic_00610 PE=4 SV=1 [Streptomyces microflavus]